METHMENSDQNLEINNRRTDEHEFILFKFQKRADLEAEYQTALEVFKGETKAEEIKIYAKIDETDLKVSTHDRNIERLSHQQESMESRLDKFLHTLKKDIDKITTKNEDLYSDFSTQVKLIDKKYTQVQVQM